MIILLSVDRKAFYDMHLIYYKVTTPLKLLSLLSWICKFFFYMTEWICLGTDFLDDHSFHGSLVSSLHYTAQARQVLVLLSSWPLRQLLPLQPRLLTVENFNVNLGSDDGIAVELGLLSVALTSHGLQSLHWSDGFVDVQLEFHLGNILCFTKS